MPIYDVFFLASTFSSRSEAVLGLYSTVYFIACLIQEGEITYLYSNVRLRCFVPMGAPPYDVHVPMHF